MSVWNKSGGEVLTDREYAALVEQYKLYVEMADRVSQRRHSANSFFLGIHTAIVAALGGLFSVDVPVAVSVTMALVGTGLILCAIWWRLVRSYRTLNTAKFAIVGRLEQRLPSSPYGIEWTELGEGADRKRYWPVTHLEKWVPITFAVLYVATPILRIAL